MAMTPGVTTVLLLVAVAQWLLCWMWIVARPRAHGPFLISTVALAFAVFLLAPSGGAAPVVAAPNAPRNAGCGAIHEGMHESVVRQGLGEPSSIVNEEETQGPAAEAWVYVDAGCVVRMLDGRVRAVDFE